MPTISVVIPCYNEEKYLGGLLGDLSRQTLAPEEVIVADCRSEDATIEVANKFRQGLDLKIVISEQRSPGGARNAGASKATSEYLLFIDADIRVPTDLVSRISESLSMARVDFVTPKYKSDGDSLANNVLFGIVDSQLYVLNKVFGRIFAIGGVICIRRSLHKEIGGFIRICRYMTMWII